MVRPVNLFGVCEEGLELIENMSSHKLQQAEKFLNGLKSGKFSVKEAQCAIPDDAPEKLKNEAARNRGKFYRGLSHCAHCFDQAPYVGYSWYHANDNSVLYVWEICYFKEIGSFTSK